MLSSEGFSQVLYLEKHKAKSSFHDVCILPGGSGSKSTSKFIQVVGEFSSCGHGPEVPTFLAVSWEVLNSSLPTTSNQ